MKTAVLLTAFTLLKISSIVTCPADNLIMTWDGKTTVINAQTFYEYKCLNGHVSLVRWDQQ